MSKCQRVTHQLRSNIIIETIHFRNKKKPYNLWEDFRNYLSNLMSEHKFCGFDVLLPAEKGRVTRSDRSATAEVGDYLQLSKTYFRKYAEYINVLLFHLYCRFIPWPNWLESCNTCFNLLQPIPDEHRREIFLSLLNEKHSPVPLSVDEKERLKAEYATMLVYAEELKDFKSSEDTWYRLLTDERYYGNLKNINEFALRFLTRTTNECTVESQVSAIESIENSSRRLKHLTAERLSFISTNGPHPYASLKVIEDSLNRYFKSKPWHFVLSNCKYYTSKVVDRQVQESQDTRFFIYKKVVYKKVYNIKWLKIKKLLIYNIQDSKKFHKKVHKKGLYMNPCTVKEFSKNA